MMCWAAVDVLLTLTSLCVSFMKTALSVEGIRTVYSWFLWRISIFHGLKTVSKGFSTVSRISILIHPWVFFLFFFSEILLHK